MTNTRSEAEIRPAGLGWAVLGYGLGCLPWFCYDSAYMEGMNTQPRPPWFGQDFHKSPCPSQPHPSPPPWVFVLPTNSRAHVRHFPEKCVPPPGGVLPRNSWADVRYFWEKCVPPLGKKCENGSNALNLYTDPLSRQVLLSQRTAVLWAKRPNMTA